MNHEEVLVQNAGSESKHRSPKDQQAVKRTPERVTSAREYTRSGLTGKLYLVQSAQNEPPEDTAGSLRDSEEATNERVIPLLTIRNSVFDNSSFNALPPPRHQGSTKQHWHEAPYRSFAALAKDSGVPAIITKTRSSKDHIVEAAASWVDTSLGLANGEPKDAAKKGPLPEVASLSASSGREDRKRWPALPRLGLLKTPNAAKRCVVKSRR